MRIKYIPKITLIATLSFITGAAALASEPVYKSNWVIFKSNIGETLLGSNAYGFTQDGKAKIVYECVNNKEVNLKYSSIGVIIEGIRPDYNSIATITFESDKDNGEFVVSDIKTRALGKIIIENLYFIELLKASNKINISIEIKPSHHDKTPTHIVNNLLFDLEYFQEAKSYADTNCNLHY